MKQINPKYLPRSMKSCSHWDLTTSQDIFLLRLDQKLFVQKLLVQVNL